MPYTEAAKNIMLDALCKGTSPSVSITHAGLLQAATGLTGLTSSGATITKTSHGYSNGDLLVFSALTGGAGLVTGGVYFAANVTTNTFEVVTKSGGTSVTPTSALTAGTVTKYTEISGGSPAYARKAIAFATASGGLSDDSTNGAVFDVPACTVSAIGEYSASTAGTLLTFTTVTPVTFAGQDTATLTDSKNDLNS